MENRVWYYKYNDLALCREKGAPIHAHEFGQLMPPEQLKKVFPTIDITNVRVASMSKKDFFAQEWPV